LFITLIASIWIVRMPEEGKIGRAIEYIM